VVDALDECNDPHAVKVVLNVLFRCSADLPIKFFVTSRPEPAIRDSMMSGIAVCNRSRSILYLHEIEKSLVQADIELYLKDELQHMLPTFCTDIEELAEQAGNLFIYAATAVRYIQAAGEAFSPKRLRTILEVNDTSKKGMSGIDALYTAIISAAIRDNPMEDDERDIIQVVLWTAVCACEPILIGTLAILSDLDEPDLAAAALHPLRSVLHVSEHNGLVTTLHASFPDFMFSQDRSQGLFCDRLTHDQFLARRCLEIMKAQLRFNICQLESSFILDEEIPDLKERIEANISPWLFYACRFWVDHLTQGGVSVTLVELVYEFLSQRLLFWMEVLNLNNCMVTGAVASTKVHLWLRTSHASSNLISLTRDAQVFVGKYASSPVSSSTPHIYISALPLSSPTNLIRLNYQHMFTGLIQATGSYMEQTDQASLQTWSIGSPIRSASFSADRKNIVIGSDNGRIFIKRSHDGQTIIDFKAHRKVISSVAFSDDGKLVVSSSYDCTICIWSVDTGSRVFGPFKGHSSRVNSAAFSPDGMHLVSGSEDCTARIWAIQDHSSSQLLTGHTAAVRSVAFSPNGLQLASGSKDLTVRIWDALSGILLRSIQGHTGPVECVQFSPCGAFVFSGSHDCTVRTWNIHDGNPIGNPFKGHSKRITSIVVSPEGERIASGSLDRTVRVWHRASGELIAGPFEGHTDSVWSVEFSADGARIISASGDRTVRVWNAQGRTQRDVNDSPSEKMLEITSTIISPDGAYIASKHIDGSFGVWNVRAGTKEWVWHLQSARNEYIVLLTFSFDGTHIFASYNYGVLHVLNVQTGELVGNPRPFSTQSLMLDSLTALSSDGRIAVSGGPTNQYRVLDLWDLQANQLVCKIQVRGDGDTYFTQAMFVSNGLRLATRTNSGIVDLWDSYTGQHAAGPFHFDLYPTQRNLGFSPDGARIFYRSSDNTTRGYNVIDGTHSTMSAPTNPNWYRVVFSPNEAYLALIGYEAIWLYNNVGEGQPVKTLRRNKPTGIDDMVFISDESYLVSIRCPHGIHIESFQVGTSNAFFEPKDDGWFLDENSNKAIWVPPEIRDRFPQSTGTTFTERGPITVDYSGVLIGEKWSQCYIGG
ncbi:hypothetical protein FRC11_008769, partial [Ceratobasidium sp. 423]